MNAVKPDPRPLIAHVLHRFDTGGLENGVVNLINRLPSDRFRHAIVALTEITEFRRRIERDDVQFVALNKPPGQGLWTFPRMRGVLRGLQPAVVHTRNLGALEMAAPAAWAGVPVRIHGEHGWDIGDPDGRSVKFRITRRVYRPFVHQYVALSQQLQRYLLDNIGVAPERVVQLYNGVDTQRFRPASGARPPIAGIPFAGSTLWLIGTVGRLSPIKDQVLLARAFVRALEWAPQAKAHLRLVLAGSGPLRSEVERVLADAGVGELAWLAGDRSDVPDIMRGLDAFALPSLAEGISNTILEAMASGLPIVATSVGGNVELLQDGATGRLVPPQDVDAMARALLDDWRDPDAARQRGRRARHDVERRFSLDGMVAAYGDLYDRLLAQAAARGALQHRFT
ncbi:TIGR03088 family PEP-CTERM/XrtA system glycosyltransferase [Piscinibacter sp. XHJ-5]|uniref:TIGR03088 family PEP-CTERM/XrtA system glycosyltransferase n=1 Tax=Piscinibacter sp. XHJ-5 TaxID=3037797 RepID=UPI0024531D37|nr:TIGR03088 family PEP-CTERM/XrtA system glycosyltransferase [Piscinibacter sp. XHJ-5]